MDCTIETSAAVGPPGGGLWAVLQETNAAVGPPGGGLWTVLQRLMLQWVPMVEDCGLYYRD